MNYLIYSAEFKINAIKEYQTKNESIRKFCNERNIKLSTFYSWLRKFRDLSPNNQLIDVTKPVKELVVQPHRKRTFTLNIKGKILTFDFDDLKDVMEILK